MQSKGFTKQFGVAIKSYARNTERFLEKVQFTSFVCGDNEGANYKKRLIWSEVLFYFLKSTQNRKNY